MRKILILSLLVVLPLGLLTGCSQDSKEKHYYVLVVEGQENLMKKFDKYASAKNPIIKIDYYKNLKDAKNKFPSYNIEEAPVVYIFSINEQIKELILHTTHTESALKELQSIKEK